MNAFSALDPSIATSDGTTFLPAGAAGMPMRDLLYAHQIGTAAGTTRKRRARARKMSGRQERQRV